MECVKDTAQAMNNLAEKPDSVMDSLGSKKDENENKVTDAEKDKIGTSAGEVIAKMNVVEGETFVDSTFDSRPDLIDMEKGENGVSSCTADSDVEMKDILGVDKKKDGDDVVAGSPVHVNGVRVDDEKLKKGGENFLEAVPDANGKNQGINGDKREDSDSMFCVGDFVWSKIKSHPWWPGQIYDPKDASEFAVRHSQEGHLLVAYFGDGSCSWCLPSQLVPFVDNFKQMLTDSSTKTFQNAINCALNDFGRLIEQSMMCKCVPLEKRDGLARPVVSNAGVRKGVLVPEVDIGRICVPEYCPTQIHDKLTSYAKFNSIDSLLELAVVKSWLSAFCRAKGGHKLPVYCEPTYIEGLEDKNKLSNEVSDEDFSVPIEVPILGPREDYWLSSPVKSQASADDKIYHRRKQKSVAELMGENGVGPKSQKRSRVKEENDVGKSVLSKGKAGKKRKVENVLDGDKCGDRVKKGLLSGKPKEIEVGENISGDELEKISSPRERKRSKYLSPPYTDLSFGLANFGSKVKSESGKFTKRDHSESPPTSISVDEELDDELPIAQLIDLDARSQTEKSDKKLTFSASDVDLEVSELLSEVQFAAVDPLYLSQKGSLDPVCAFLSSFRRLTYLQGSDHGTLKKTRTLGKKRKPLNDEENEITSKKVKSADESKTPKPLDSQGRKSDKPRSKKSSDFSRARKSVENFEGCASTCLIVTFSPGFPLPSKEQILGLFDKFGSLNEKETNVLTGSHAARIVYTDESDAETAFMSSIRESPFGVDNVNYWLQHSPAGSKSRPLISPLASDKSTSPGQMDDFMVDVRAIRRKLELMTAILENYHSKFSSEEKSGLKNDMKQLMENVETVSDKVRVMAEKSAS